MESPPTSKKSSCTPTRDTPTIDATMSASACSVGERGATKPSAAPPRSSGGAGSRSRSTLPLGDSGSASSSTKADGTMYGGSRDSRNWRSSRARTVEPGRATT